MTCGLDDKSISCLKGGKLLRELFQIVVSHKGQVLLIGLSF